MNLKLIILFLFIKCTFYAQTSINNFFSEPMTNFALVTSSSTIDQSANGADLVWSFNNFSQVGNTKDSHLTPSSNQISTYPGTTLLITTTDNDTMDENTFFIKEDSNVVSITGLSNTNLTLNYSVNNALLGSYPLNYNDSTTDNFAGNYNYNADDGTMYAGNFTGNIVTTVDAYGTLKTNDLLNQSGFNGKVTRIKSVQNLNLSYSFLGNVGTADITTYNYYNNSNGNLIFRSNNIVVSVPLLSVDQNTTTYEIKLNNTLTVGKTELGANEVSVYPNPVADVLNIYLPNNPFVKSIKITDNTGKVVLKTDKKNLYISKLQSGFYFATITTNNNRFRVKFIKN